MASITPVADDEMYAMTEWRAELATYQHTGHVCTCPPAPYDPARRWHGFPYRDRATGLLHSRPRVVFLSGCRWCGNLQQGHKNCQGLRPHDFEPPTPAQISARRVAASVTFLQKGTPS
ncbi:hypothetical protein [Streptomyces albidoflavus]|uniref:hypothetical protein n=1 Tax=Streptomyces albidoflavus TaxID=1886 RepID=UPI0010220F2A|nr:hypothetical protein [Streptomyces albidoflavus]RZF02877.1 hypothetical protein C0R05_32195 [Streptomyces albidoflavus]